MGVYLDVQNEGDDFPLVLAHFCFLEVELGGLKRGADALEAAGESWRALIKLEGVVKVVDQFLP